MVSVAGRILEEAALAATERALAYLRSAYVSKRPVGLGKSGDVSREFDVVVERVIFRTLRNYLKDVMFVSEEVGKFGEGVWLAIVDPVDGSVNYEAGIPIASVSIGIARNSENARVSDIEVAAVAEVFRDVIYFYSKSSGFSVIGARARRKSSPSNILLGYFEDLESFKPYLRVKEVADPRPRLRSLGSAALDIVYVSLGMGMGFIDARSKLRNVDIAPSLAIADYLGSRAYLCDGTDARTIPIKELMKVECLVVGYDEEVASKLLYAVSKRREP